MKSIYQKALIWSWMVLLAWSSSALSAETPSSLAGATVISAEQAREMQSKGVLVVDTRVAFEYVEQHIKGAISIPYKEKSEKSVDFDARLDSFDLSKLPAKDTPIIFYCNAIILDYFCKIGK